MVRALDIKGETNIHSNLAKSINDLRNERVPKKGFNAEYIQDLLCRRGFEHMKVEKNYVLKLQTYLDLEQTKQKDVQHVVVQG